MKPGDIVENQCEKRKRGHETVIGTELAHSGDAFQGLEPAWVVIRGPEREGQWEKKLKRYTSEINRSFPVIASHLSC